MSTTEKFNQTPDAQYGKCKTCEIELATEDVANIHMSATMAEATAKGENRGHTVRVLNPSRERRISREVGEIVSEAIGDAMSKLEELVYHEHITEGEAKEAIRHYMDFADAWEEYSE